MAHPSLPITFDAILIDEARQMSRRPHMDPELYRILKQNIPSLGWSVRRSPPWIWTFNLAKIDFLLQYVTRRMSPTHP
jgi:hypothetical protein